MKNWFTHLLDRSQTTSCLDSKLFFNIYQPTISLCDIYVRQYLFLNKPGRRLEIDWNIVLKSHWQMFQIILLLLKDNNCAKSFWNLCISVQVMAWTSSIYDHFIIWSSSVTLTFNLPQQMFQMKNCAKLFWNPCINVKYDLDLQSTRTNVSDDTASYQGEQLCQIIWNPCIIM